VLDRNQYRTDEEDAKASKQQHMSSTRRLALPPHTTLQQNPRKNTPGDYTKSNRFR
jgi:hypothetical protein